MPEAYTKCKRTEPERRGVFEFGDEVFKFTDGIDPVQLAAVVYERGEVRPGGRAYTKETIIY